MSLLCCSSSLALTLVVCPNASPGPALCGFSAHSSLSQNPFFPPFLCFCHSAALRSASQTTSLEWHRLLPVSRLVRISSHSSCCQELFSRHSRGIDTTILWTSCVISSQKSSSSSMYKVEDNCSSLGSGELRLTHPGCCFGSSLQPTMDFKLLWPGSELFPYLTEVKWVTDET